MSVILAAGGIVSAITTKGIALCIYYDRNTLIKIVYASLSRMKQIHTLFKLKTKRKKIT